MRWVLPVLLCRVVLLRIGSIVKDSSQFLSVTQYDSLTINSEAILPHSHTSRDDHKHFEGVVLINSIPPSLLRLHDDEDL